MMGNAVRWTSAQYAALMERRERNWRPSRDAGGGEASKRPGFRLTPPTQKQLERMASPKEVQVHTAYVAWCRRMQNKVPALARGFHPANGEERDPRVGAKLKRLGVRAGVLDYCFCVPRGGFAGFWLEFKAPGKKPTPEQQHEIRELQKDGYLVHVCDDWQLAAQLTIAYLDGKIVRE